MILEETFILADLLQDRFIARDEHITEITDDLKDGLREYKKSNRDKITNFLKALGIEEFLNDFKGKTSSGKGYVFFEEEKDFIIAILEVSKEDKYRKIRERRYSELTDDESIEMYTMVCDMLTRRNFSGGELNDRLVGSYNLLDFPIHRINKKILKMKDELDKIEKFMFSKRNKEIISPDDNFEWIKFVEADLDNRYAMYIKLYQEMIFERRDEKSELASEFYFGLSSEEIEAIELNDMVKGRIYAEYMEMGEVKKLIKRENEIKQEPDFLFGNKKMSTREMHKMIEEHDSKKDYNAKEVQELLKIMNQKNKCWKVAEKKALQDLSHETGMTEEELMQDPVFNYDGLLTTQELLHKCIKEIGMK